MQVPLSVTLVIKSLRWIYGSIQSCILLCSCLNNIAMDTPDMAQWSPLLTKIFCSAKAKVSNGSLRTVNTHQNHPQEFENFHYRCPYPGCYHKTVFTDLSERKQHVLGTEHKGGHGGPWPMDPARCIFAEFNDIEQGECWQDCTDNIVLTRLYWQDCTENVSTMFLTSEVIFGSQTS